MLPELLGETLAELGTEALQLLTLRRVLELHRASFERVVCVLVGNHTFRVSLFGRIPPFFHPAKPEGVGTCRLRHNAATNAICRPKRKVKKEQETKKDKKQKKTRNKKEQETKKNKKPKEQETKKNKKQKRTRNKKEQENKKRKVPRQVDRDTKKKVEARGSNQTEPEGMQSMRLIAGSQERKAMPCSERRVGTAPTKSPDWRQVMCSLPGDQLRAN